MDKKKIGFWLVTLFVLVPQIGAGFAYFAGAMDEAMTHLSYPLYFAKILGVWKLLGAVAILSPRFAPWVDRVKDAAYAGYFIVFSSAFVSHMAVGDSLGESAPPVVMAILLAVSFALRPKD